MTCSTWGGMLTTFTRTSTGGVVAWFLEGQARFLLSAHVRWHNCSFSPCVRANEILLVLTSQDACFMRPSRFLEQQQRYSSFRSLGSLITLFNLLDASGVPSVCPRKAPEKCRVDELWTMASSPHAQRK
eukprot:6181559-Pleurochrysis_carterae.AAC.1